ncbi:polysaccharide deacetylase family protein [Micromonospora sp. WMMD812]|uniref:polysaccharide deacetylase family protein n=1 Tax=Micromonospora sp. WMMD812 TaxID=3015152 RepID=UPI00248D09C2|nr:polysaccharide deacetylase family protein [Micromonospora sp. WMMD812]WBB65570.1 polysaccharide deacetylase family protein [Micromonospora sp. WMMD812]
MKARAVLAYALGLVLVLGGCAQPGGTVVAHDGPAPASSAPPPSPKPSASPRPTRTATTGRPVRPRPNTLPAGLRRTTGARTVALTFDDGPSPAWTPKILDQLRAARVTATFCVVGREVQRHPELVRRIVREGHQLCNHSWRHDVDLGRLPVAEIRADLVRTNKAIQAAAPGAPITFYRQPGGRWTPEVVAVAKQLGMRPLHWSVDPQDWAKPPAATISHRVLTAVRPGSIVLLHDGGGDRAATFAACPRVIAELKRRFGVTRLR